MKIGLLDIIFIISFFGIVYYTIWVIILVVHSVHDPEYRIDFENIDPKLQLFVLIPMLNEAGVVHQTLAKFLEHTQTLPQVQLGVIDDCSSDGTADLIQQFIDENKCGKKIHLIRRTFPNAQTGKGDALNYGLGFIRQTIKVNEEETIIGVLDADAVMKEKDFQKVLLQFSIAPKLALLQTKVRMLHARNWLPKMQDIEFATINDWIQRVRNKIDNAAASGNGQFIRMSSVSGNDTPWGNALLEDFEFSTNFLLDNKSTYRTDIIVYQEAVNKVKPFIRQRSRWVQGRLDCTFKYMYRILHSPYLKFWAKFEMIFFMLLPFFTLIVGFCNFSSLIFALCNFALFRNLMFGLTGINFLLATHTAIKYCGHDQKLRFKTILYCASMMIYNIILFPAIIIAFYRKVTNKQQWIKTTHGVSTVSS